VTEQEYLDMERSSEIKHEFHAGEVFAMAGGTPDHALITMNLGSTLKQAVKGLRCLVYSPDLRIKVEATDLYTYPDVSLLCGEPKFTKDNPPALTNPTLLAEVLSESSEGYDRGKKFHHYSRIPSLAAYLLVSQNTPAIEQLVRQAESMGASYPGRIGSIRRHSFAPDQIFSRGCVRGSRFPSIRSS
jgi:Uma2 family endonuclease